MKAIVSALQRQGWPAQVVAVVSSNPNAQGLLWAQQQGLETRVVAQANYVTREACDQALAECIQGFDPHYVLLAGFMRILSEPFVRQFAGRLINIHPSLLPAFPGLKTHEQALAAGVQWHGCTVHFVTPQLDSGPIIGQAAVFVHPDDTPELLAARVLAAEHRLYPEVVSRLVQGHVCLSEAGKVSIGGEAPGAFVALSPAVYPAQLKVIKAGNEFSQ